MPASKQDKVLLACPHCGHQQAEPRMAFSTLCKKCHGHYYVQNVLKPAPRSLVTAPAPNRISPSERRRITCFDCGTELVVAISAESTMCKRCGRYMDLKDYRITDSVARSFKTKGVFVVETKGHVFDSEAIVSHAVIKGRFSKKLIVERSLTIYSTAQIKGIFKAGRLIIPAANHFRWNELIKVGSAEIAGELAANLHAEGTVVLKSTARLFGDVEAGNLEIEDGAVIVGHARITARP
jgi:cytoskeletal protein CcmA (bactofilin family)/transcription elongation factor Elf1